MFLNSLTLAILAFTASMLAPGSIESVALPLYALAAVRWWDADLHATHFFSRLRTAHLRVSRPEACPSGRCFLQQSQVQMTVLPAPSVAFTLNSEVFARRVPVTVIRLVIPRGNLIMVPTGKGAGSDATDGVMTVPAGVGVTMILKWLPTFLITSSRTMPVPISWKVMVIAVSPGNTEQVGGFVSGSATTQVQITVP